MTSSLFLRRSGIVRLLLVGLLTVFALCANATVRWVSPTGDNNTGVRDTATAACADYGNKYAPGHAVTTTYDPAYQYFFCGWDGYDRQISTTSSGICNDGSRQFDKTNGRSMCPEDAPTLAPMDATTPCFTYPGLAALAAADNWVREPRTFEYNVRANGIGKITGKTATGKDFSYAVDCYGKGRVTDGDGDKLPAPTPSPAPPVDTAYPRCGAGNYLYTDESGSSQCSQNLPDRTLADCGSKNGGYVNGKAVCLPSNPAPSVAANAANTAQQKADAAVTAGRATSGAVQAANDAAAAYRRAAEAANSMPDSAAAQASAQTAYQSAAQAAIAAGMAVPSSLPLPGTATGTGTGGTGSGSQNSGPVECGSPGKPPCKIDESGTGTAADMVASMKPANDSVSKAWDDIQAEINKQAGSDAEKTSILGWGFQFSLPTSCSTYPMFLNVTIDFCKFQPVVHELMSLIWLTATMWICIGMVGRTLRGAP